MESHHTCDETAFAQQHNPHQHTHPAAHQIHVYQTQSQQQHEVHVQPQEVHVQQQSPPQQQQPQQQQHLMQPKSNHALRNNNNHHHSQHQQQLIHTSRLQQMSHNHIANGNNHNGGASQRHHNNNNISQQQQLQHNQMNFRHNRNNLTTQNRPVGNNLPFQQQQQQQQRYPANHATHLHHQILPTGFHHNQPHIAAPTYIRQDGELPLRILVQSDMVGAIIGRSGSTIKQITQQTKARIDVHRDDGPDQQEKVITFNGTPESCSAACFKILEVIINEKLQLNNNNNTTHSDNNNKTSASDESIGSGSSNSDVQLKILAYNNLIGRLIGRSGASIKKIMEQTSTKINISVNSLSDCTNERIITVVGNLEQVRQAEQVISAKLRAAHMSDMSDTMQAMNQQPYLFNNVPMPYMPSPYAQNPILSTLVNTQAGHGGHSLTRGMAAHQGQVSGQPLYPSSSNYLSLYSNIGVPPTGPAGLLRFNPAGLELERETVDIYIPNSMVGAIIGKSGSAIKEMISHSGASIKVAAAPTQGDQVLTNNTSKDEDSTEQQQRQQSQQPQSQPEDQEQNQEEQQEQEPQEQQDERQEHESQTKSDSVNESESNQEAEETQQERGDEEIPLDSTQDSQTPAVTSPQSVPRQHNNHESHPSNRKVTIVGYPEAQWSAQYMIYRKVSLESGKSDINLMVEIQVPSQLVGKIIGKGGATVKNLQKQTRTTIRLPDEKPSSSDAENDTETTVQITGEFQSSQLAQLQIRNLIKESLYLSSRKY